MKRRGFRAGQRQYIHAMMLSPAAIILHFGFSASRPEKPGVYVLWDLCFGIRHFPDKHT